FFSSSRRHTSSKRDWSSDVCSSDLVAEPADPPAEGIAFDKRDIPHCLTSFLYPDDSDRDGQLLRVYQQYFMVSAGAQMILEELRSEERRVGEEGTSGERGRR